MKMNFKNAKKHPVFKHKCIFSLVLVLFSVALNAEVAVKSTEKNDKVSADTRLEQKNPPVQGVAASSLKKAGVLVLNAEQWELARSGESILSLPALNTLVNRWLDDRQKKIEIQYPGGEEGEFWQQELSDWLVSLGISSSNIVAVPGSGADDMIKFSLIK